MSASTSAVQHWCSRLHYTMHCAYSLIKRYNMQPALAESTVDANTDFYCKLTCTSGTGASPNATFIAPPGIYDPPYKINNNNTQLELSTKARHFLTYQLV